MNRVNYMVSNDLGQRYFPSGPKGTLGIVLVALCRYDDLCNYVTITFSFIFIFINEIIDKFPVLYDTIIVNSVLM
jgi:hypothetical protein